ncbi:MULTISPECIES: hypothetical protein [Delftia]|jgi:hypothetical protein|uniref:hypothetical protein n=1 Tax=Delftia TaxID=80865 RepID=UPI00034EA588|nr:MULTISPECIES: hypothetical protein [Delftia]EPD41129.1 hypothetical protein HMPREF9702_03230 [Delftia acidovorans CCUG 15835]MDH0422503.1 hypothetical protein [Delftia tsuruhatensis]WON87395.1 hypothetical protein OK021_21975 [Delftia sp. UGAL515B_04]
MTARKCLFCGGKAELLCDTWLGWERKRAELEKKAPHLLAAPSHAIPIRYRAVHTCDAPLCQACVHSAGTMFFRMRGHGSWAESIDYCPGHDSGDRRTEITGLQAEAMRARWRAGALARRGLVEQGGQQLGLFMEQQS